MITVYDYAHTRMEVEDEVYEEIVTKYSKPDEIARVVDFFDDKIMEHARLHLPAILFIRADIVYALYKLDGVEPDIARKIAPYVAVNMVDYMRRHSMFKNIRYTGQDIDFVVEP